MQKIRCGVRYFHRNVYQKHRAEFEQIAQKTQTPRALFITCSDSRISPNLVTQTEPGDLFIIRNAGNIIPPPGIFGGEAATIEYAVSVLGVKNIVLCGHSSCGAMKALIQDGVTPFPAVNEWFHYADATRRIVKEKHSHLPVDQMVIEAAKENVLVQLNHVQTHPAVAVALAKGEMNLFGWFYDLAEGNIYEYSPAEHQYVLINPEDTTWDDPSLEFGTRFIEPAFET